MTCGEVMENLEFKALVVTEFKKKKFERKIQTRRIEDLPEGEVLVRVKYSSLNYKDAQSAIGNKGITPNYPHTPGIDAAGIVVESSVASFSPGDEVIVMEFDLGMGTDGGYGQYIRVPYSWVLHLPESLSLRESMIYGTGALTAAISIDKLMRNGLEPGLGEVLVTGATGGVGSMAVSILAKLGYQVVASTGKPEEAEFLKDLGAQEVLDRNLLSLDSFAHLGKARWAGVVDTVGGPTLSTAIRTVKTGGSVTCCGMVTAVDFRSSIFPFILRGVNLLGVDCVHVSTDHRKKMWELLTHDWKLDTLEILCTEGSLEDLDQQIDVMLAGKSKGRFIVNLELSSPIAVE